MNLFAKGTIWMLVQDNGANHPPSLSRYTLRLYLEDIPVDNRPPPTVLGPPGDPNIKSYVRIYIDNNRFTGPDEFFAANDAYFEFNIRNGLAKSTYRYQLIGVPGWVKKSNPVEFSVKPGGCQPDPSTAFVDRCNAELTIPLPDNTNEPPAENLEPGFGFGMTDVSDMQGGFPEDIKLVEPYTPKGEIRARTRLHTILLSRPRGFPLKLMSFNIHRFGSSLLQGDFAKVKNDSIGQFIAQNNPDILAIQEGWDKGQVEAILNAANKYRLLADPKARNYKMYGVVDRNPSWSKSLAAFSSNLFGETTGTHGGLWIFSHLNEANRSAHVFSTNACKGEDCLKGKGVQWVRFNLNEPDPLQIQCRTPVNIADTVKELGNNCPPLASGDQYVDVFNTHLQANNVALCEDSTLKTLALDTLLLYGTGLVVPPLKDLIQIADWNCLKSYEEVRSLQLQEMNSFVEKVTADSKDRPSLIFGDFNLDGIHLIDDGDLKEEYRTMINTLRIGPTMPQNQKSPPNDVIHPWPDAFDWDIDHGDVVRERPGYDDIVTPVTTDQNGAPYRTIELTGTHITGGADDDEEFEEEKKSHLVSNQDWMGNYRGNERFDFVLVRPAYVWDDPNFQPSFWVAAPNPKEENVWSSPWPGLSGQEAFGKPPSRLSDHKPVIANLEWIPMGQRSSYQGTWKHLWSSRITSLDMSQVGDCKKDPDPRPTMKWGKIRLDGAVELFPDHVGHECEDMKNASWPTNGKGDDEHNECTENWIVSAKQDPSIDSLHASGIDVFEIDTFCGPDDFVSLLSDGRRPYVEYHGKVEENLGLLRFVDGNFVRWLTDWPITDNASISRCTHGGEGVACLQTNYPELPPGEQF